MTDTEAEIRAIVQAGLDTISNAATNAKDALIATGDKRIAATTSATPDAEVEALARRQVTGEASYWSRFMPAHSNAKLDFDGMTGDNQQAVCEGIRWVLASLADAGRLFPATEPAEEAPNLAAVAQEPRRFTPAEECQNDNHDPGCVCGAQHWMTTPAPAVPAEEETKAEEGPWVHKNGEICVHAPQCAAPYVVGKFNAHGDFIKHAGELRLPEGFTRLAPASSPVVPAPTETGPWPTWQEVPDGVWYMSRDRVMHNRYVNHGGTRRSNAGFPGLADYDGRIGGFNAAFAPFVAAEEKDA